MNRSFALFLLLAATACAQDHTKYPSLALRPIETRSDEPDPDATPAPEAADAALDAQIATITAAADRNATDFAATLAKAQGAAKAKGARTTGSDAWLTAQTSLADLEALHGDLLGTAGDLDRLSTDRSQAGASAYPSLDAAQAKAQAQLDGQTAAIAAVKSSLGEN